MCDGFVGNVALKASEGVAAMIVGGLKQEFKRNIFYENCRHRGLSGSICADEAYGLPPLQRRGAARLRGTGVQEPCPADALAFEQALNRAYDAARNNLLDRVRSRIAHAASLLASSTAQSALATAAPLP